MAVRPFLDTMRQAAARGELPLEIARERVFGAGRYVTRLVEEPKEVEYNRRFATNRFVQLGKISPGAVDSSSGLLKDDPFHDAGMAHYFTTYDTALEPEIRGTQGGIAAVGKLIWSPEATLCQLSTPFDQIDKDMRAEMDQLEPGKVADLRSLAKRDHKEVGMPTARRTSQVATLGVLREMYAFAEKNDIRYLVAGLEPRAWPDYHKRFHGGVELMHAEDVRMIFPGIEGHQVGIRMPIADSYERYRKATMEGPLGMRILRLMMMEYYANKVESYRGTGSPRLSLTDVLLMLS